jgi:hypothetical protein
MLMHKNSKKNTKDKVKAGPATTGSFGNSTDANLTAASSGSEDYESNGLLMHFKDDKKQP